MSIVPVLPSHKDSPVSEIRVTMLDECSQGNFIYEGILSHFSGDVGEDTIVSIQTSNGHVTDARWRKDFKCVKGMSRKTTRELIFQRHPVYQITLLYLVGY